MACSSCVSYLVCRPSDIAELENSNALAPFALTLTRTGTDQIFNPTRGSNVVLDFESARSWTGSAFAYDRFIRRGELVPVPWGGM